MGEVQEDASRQALDRPGWQRADDGALNRSRGGVPFGSRANIRFGAAVSGSFLVASVIGLGFEAGRDARALTITAFGSMVAFWLANWWSEVVGAQISVGDAFRCRDALVIAGREWPLVEAGLLSTVLLALAWVGVWSRETGAALAMAAAIAQIVGWGLVAGRRAGGTWPRAGLFAAVEGALGVGLLLLERLIH